MKIFIKLIIIAISFLCFSPQALAETMRKEIIVGTREIPPFVIFDEQGELSGITIDLWQRIAEALDLEYRFKLLSLDEMIQQLASKDIDVAAAALSITSERERIIDFSHPFYHTGLGIAVSRKPIPTWWGIIRGFVSLEFARVVGVLVLILFVFGFLIWLFERKHNSEQFDTHPKKGLGSGFWWAAVTMTTVGYGDKAPRTLGGRFIALVWMFLGIFIISSITAAITSALTVASLEFGIQGPKDLAYVHAGTIQNTTSANYFIERGMYPELYETVHDALQALAKGEIEAVVYDASILAYLVNKQYAGRLTVLESIFEQQQYGFGLPVNSPLRQSINHELLVVIESGDFQRIQQRYLGQ